MPRRTSPSGSIAPARHRSGGAEPPPTSAQLLDALRAEIGLVGDHVIAQRAGLTRSVVGLYRRRHGIPAYEGYKFEKGHRAADGAGPAAPTPVELEAPAVETAELETAELETAELETAELETAELETAEPETDAVERAVVARRPRRTRLDPHLHLIGVLPDAEVARRAGVTPANVRAWRTRRGLAPAPRDAAIKPTGMAPPSHANVAASVAGEGQTNGAATVRRRGPRSAIEPWEHLVGSVPDAEIARLAGVTLSAALQFRRRRGIRARASTVEVAAVPDGAEARVVATGAARVTANAYGVTARQGQRLERFIVVGADILDGARRAAEALGRRGDGAWIIQGVRALAEALV